MALPSPDRPKVQAYDWPQFVRWFAPKWNPGDHISIFGPTGSGKTTLGVALAQSRNWSFAPDVKAGGDETLAQAIKALAWERTVRWPPSLQVREKIKNGEPVHLVVGSRARTNVARAKNRSFVQGVLASAWEHGNWTVLADEMILLAKMGAKEDVEEMLIAARNLGMSVVAMAQSMSTGLPLATNQATWVFMGYTRDREMCDRMATAVGRPGAEIRGAVKGLVVDDDETQPHNWLLVGRNPLAPLVVCRPPFVADQEHADAEPPKIKATLVRRS